MKKYMLTAKGRCLLDYLKKIIDGDWRVEDYIEAYEDTINDQLHYFERAGITLDRKTLAQTLYDIVATYDGFEEEEDDQFFDWSFYWGDLWSFCYGSSCREVY